VQYTKREQVFLAILAFIGVAGLNGVFLWAVLRRPEALSSALTNPIAAAFIAEAFILVGVLAYFLARWRLSRVHWAWFVLLSLVGGLVFALPVALLWRSDGGAR